MMSGGTPMCSAGTNASQVLDSLVLEYLERKQLTKTAAAYKGETGLQEADAGIHALQYCFLSQWFEYFWNNWYLKQHSPVTQSQNHGLNSAMAAAHASAAAAAAVSGPSQLTRPTTPFSLVYQSQGSTRASTPSAMSQYTMAPSAPASQLGSHSSGSMVSPTAMAGMQPAAHSEPDDLLAMSQRLLANSSINGALSQKLGSTPELQAGPGPLLASPFQQQGSMSSATTAQLGMLNMGPHAQACAQPSGSGGTPPAGPGVRRNLSSHFLPSAGQEARAAGLKGHHSASCASGQSDGRGLCRPFTQFSQEFTPFTSMLSGALDAPPLPGTHRKSHSHGMLHSTPSAPPGTMGPLTPPSRKRKVELQGEPPKPQVLLHPSAGGSSLYGQSGDQITTPRHSDASDTTTICSPQFMLPLDIDFMNAFAPGNGDKPKHAHSMPAAIGQDCDLDGLDGLLPLLDDADLQLPDAAPNAGRTLL